MGMYSLGDTGRHPLSVTSVRFYCSNCKFDRTYQTEEEVPSRCPQCQAGSRPQYAWFRNKVPFLPALVSLGLLSSLGLYDLSVTRAMEFPWPPYVIALTIFGLAWMLTTLLLSWPRPLKGPQIIPNIRWSRQDSSPQDVVGFRIVVTLEGHYPRKTFTSRIEGYRPIVMDLEADDAIENDRVYVLKPEQSDLEATSIFFHPEWVRFKRGAQRKLRKMCKGSFSFKPSIEELLLNQEGPFREIYGKIYKVQNPDTLTKHQIPWSLLDAMASEYGRVGPSRGQ